MTTTVAKKRKENATDRARLFPSTMKRVKIRAAKTGLTIAEVIDALERGEKI